MVQGEEQSGGGEAEEEADKERENDWFLSYVGMNSNAIFLSIHPTPVYLKPPSKYN